MTRNSFRGACVALLLALSVGVAFAEDAAVIAAGGEIA